MVNLSPDTARSGAWEAGYRYDSEYIHDFSHVHAWQLAGIAVLPAVDSSTGPAPDPEPPVRFVLATRRPLHLEANPLDDLEIRPLPDRRRIPLAEVRPIIRGDLAILPGHGGPQAIGLVAPYHTVWTLPPSANGSRGSRGALRDVPWIGLADDGRLLLPLRTPKPEYHRTIQQIQDPLWGNRGWQNPGLFRWPVPASSDASPPEPMGTPNPARTSTKSLPTSTNDAPSSHRPHPSPGPRSC